MSVNIHKQLAAIAGYTVELTEATNLYTVIEDDQKLGLLGGYLVEILTGTFGRDNRIPIYEALLHLSLVEVSPYVNYIMTPWYKNNYTSYRDNTDDFFMLYAAVILVELDDNGEETAIAHIFKERDASSSGYAITAASTYAKANTDKRFSVYVVQRNDNNTGTSMFDSSFYQCTTIVHAYIFINGLTTINYRAFRECSNLETVDIFDAYTVTSQIGVYTVTIGNQAFYACRKLKRFHIEGRISSIGDSAFRYCQSMTQFDIVATGTWPAITVNAYAFEGCSALREMPDEFWASVQYLYEYSFDMCYSLTRVGAMPKIRLIRDGVFYQDINLRQVGDPNVSSGAATFNLGMKAFAGCVSLTNIYNLDTVEYLAARVYDGCVRLESTGLKSGVFKGCRQGYSDTNTLGSQHLISLTDISFVYGVTDPPTQFLQYTGVTTVTTDLPYLAPYMFRLCDHLTSVELSSSITSIPDGCFSYCCRLSSIIIPSSVETISSTAFYASNLLATITIKGKHAGDITGAPWGASEYANIIWEADL